MNIPILKITLRLRKFADWLKFDEFALQRPLRESHVVHPPAASFHLPSLRPLDCLLHDHSRSLHRFPRQRESQGIRWCHQGSSFRPSILLESLHSENVSIEKENTWMNSPNLQMSCASEYSGKIISHYTIKSSKFYFWNRNWFPTTYAITLLKTSQPESSENE